MSLGNGNGGPMRDPALVTRNARELRRELRSLVLMALLAVFGLGVFGYLVAHERIEWPGWVPFVGQHPFLLSAEVSAVSGVLPGQGQAVTVSGVTVGQISGVALRHGEPVITMKIDPQYAGRLYSNASVLLRPKTGLNDMVAELDPGSAAGGHRLHNGATLGAANTLPTVNFDEILAQLDTDTRAELMELITNGGQALSGRGGRELGNVFRDFNPLSRDVERASQLVAQRGAELRTLMGNLAKIATELGANENQLTRFVRGNAGVWHAFASQDQSLQQTIRLLPGALSSTNTALDKATLLGNTMQATFSELLPSARSLGPTLKDLRPFFKRTTPVLADELRPFSVAAQPTARILAPATRRLAKATPGLSTLARELDNIVNELAYKPKSGQPYLFYVPWDNHNTNSVLSNQDGIGPLRQSMLLFPCGTLQLINQTYVDNPQQNPTLLALIELLDLPNFSRVCKDSNSGPVPK
jgi:phospholipid/cholesterol/gamma-HCH transport system substrate-binding protein